MSSSYLSPFQFLTAQSMTGSFNSSSIQLNTGTCISIQAVWSGGGSPVGSLKLQVSNDRGLQGGQQVSDSQASWTDVTSPAAIAVSGNAGSAFFDFQKTAAFAVRLVYTVTSGTATMNAYACVKNR